MAPISATTVLDTRSRLVETHVSTLIFLGDRVYKLKKPVALDFVDLTAREDRERICRREVELNRRLAPDVYLGVADVVGPDGHPCDHLVVMRRLPDERRLSTLVVAGGDVDDELRRIAHVLARFHSTAETSAVIAQAGRPDALRKRWDNAFDTMEHCPAVYETVDLIKLRMLAHRYLDGRTALLEQRIADGRVCDGHGDLQADDIFCLEDGPRILDCVEFDDALRHGDVLADVAFLSMDLERLGAPGPAARILALHRELSNDSFPMSLADHYVAQRAQVRSMVAALRAQQGDEAAMDVARDLAAMTHEHLERSRVRMVLVGGLPGTGKTTLANTLSDSLGWSVLHADEVRKDVFGIPHLAHVGRDRNRPETGLYTAPNTNATYAELLARARELLGRGESVILDASWTDATKRAAAEHVARETTTDLVELCCVAPRSVADARLIARNERGDDASDATPEVATFLAGRAHPWPDATIVDTTSRADASRVAIRAATRPWREP